MHPLEPDQNHLHHLLYSSTGSYKGTLLTIFVYLSIFGVMAIVSLVNEPGLIPMICYLCLVVGLVLVHKITDFGLRFVNRITEKFNWDEDNLPGYQMLVRIRFLPILSLSYYVVILVLSSSGQDWSTAAPILLFSILLIMIFSIRGTKFPHNAEILVVAVGIVQICFLTGIDNVIQVSSKSSYYMLLGVLRFGTLGLITVITAVNYIARSKSFGVDFWKISDLLIFFILIGLASIKPLGIGISVTMAAEMGILYLANKLGLPRMLSYFASFKLSRSPIISSTD